MDTPHPDYYNITWRGLSFFFYIITNITWGVRGWASQLITILHRYGRLLKGGCQILLGVLPHEQNLFGCQMLDDSYPEVRGHGIA